MFSLAYAMRRVVLKVPLSRTQELIVDIRRCVNITLNDQQTVCIAVLMSACRDGIVYLLVSVVYILGP